MLSFGDITTVVRLLWEKVRADNSADSKRAKLAKAIRDVHRDLEELIGNGRLILRICSNDSSGEAVPTLTRQLEILSRLKESFESEPLSDVVAVHLPEVSKNFERVIEGKRERVWIRLEEILGKPPRASGHDFVDNLAAVWPENAPAGTPALYRIAANARRVPRAHPDDIKQGQIVLDDLARASEDLRHLLVDKFKVEDLA